MSVSASGIFKSIYTRVAKLTQAYMFADDVLHKMLIIMILSFNPSGAVQSWKILEE